MTVHAAALEVGGILLSIEDVVAVARAHVPVRLAAAAVARMERTRAVVERGLTGDRPVYGLTTGLGAAVDTPLPSSDLAEFQRRVVLGRAVGVGDLLTTEEVRATLLARLAGFAHGASGASPAFAGALCSMLNEGVHPRVRRTGTLGEADLSPLAGLFLPLAGGGEAEWGGTVWPGPEALRRAGVQTPPFGPKDGIALVSANAFSTGLAALTLHEAGLALEALTAAGALSMEAFRANLSPLDRRVVALRPSPGQTEGTERLHALLQGSNLFEAGAARRVQDPLSFRCLAPVHGAALDRLAAARVAVEVELNGAGDSPAVLVADGEILSTVNFDTTALSLSFEALGLAAAHAGALSVFRATKLMSPAQADLPRFLTRLPGHSGFAPAQKTAAALEAEIRHLCAPLGAMAAPVADGVEDYAPMTSRVVEKTRDIARRLARLAAVELVVAAQAVDLRGGIRLGQGTGAAHAFVRARVAFLEEDRPMGEEFETLAQAIESGALRDTLAAGATSA